MNDHHDEDAVIALLRHAARDVELDLSRVWSIVRVEMSAAPASPAAVSAAAGPGYRP